MEFRSDVPLGITLGVRYETCSFDPHPGNRLSFYSEGVVEAQSPSGEFIGTAAIGAKYGIPGKLCILTLNA